MKSISCAAFLLAFCLLVQLRASVPPNLLIIYADDLGFGDASCYGATEINTPNIDRLASQGLKFLNAHAASATCTPSRYAMLTGTYAWRKKGTSILSGNAGLILRPDQITLPSLMRNAKYVTGVVGKWHLGLGTDQLDYNGEIKPGPLEVGFDYCFLIPATGDRVPCVYVENHRVVGLDPGDPIEVSYREPVGSEPLGRDHPELLKVKPRRGADQAIVNGISRIGYMSGGKAAHWVDEEMADVLTSKAVSFIEEYSKRPFFLYFSTHDIHVPRVPHPRFEGASGLGVRGDAILQLDWCVGELLKTLDQLNLAENTLVIFTSDNGPVVSGAYYDEAAEKLGGHKPGGALRGGKFSAFEAGTRIPMIVRWPKRVTPGTTRALVSQLDFLASLANLTGQDLEPGEAPDSVDILPALLGESEAGRDHLVKQALVLSLLKGRWKYIEPGRGPKVFNNTMIESGLSQRPQLYDLERDPGEQNNVAADHPEIVRGLSSLLQEIRDRGRSQ